MPSFPTVCRSEKRNCLLGRSGVECGMTALLDSYDIYLLTAIGLSPGGCSTVHIYTQTVHRTTQNKQYIEQHNNLGECGPCPVLASYNLDLSYN